MTWNKPFVWSSAVVSVAWLLAGARPAPAQLMSTWGHPVITLGATPYDSINLGHGGAYSGGPGFIPGYGYYPRPGPGTYPWLDGPGVPFDRRKLSPPPGVAIPPSAGAPLAEESPPPGCALVLVKIPDEAELWFGDAKTTQGGSYRRFTTPPLPEGRRWSYILRVRWRIGDAELRREEEVEVRPGQTVTVNFLTTDSWTGRRVAAEAPH